MWLTTCQGTDDRLDCLVHRYKSDVHKSNNAQEKVKLKSSTAPLTGICVLELEVLNC